MINIPAAIGNMKPEPSWDCVVILQDSYGPKKPWWIEYNTNCSNISSVIVNVVIKKMTHVNK